MGYAFLTATLLLLIQYGREEAAVIISSNSNGNVKSGNNISLDISYTTQGSYPIVSWVINSTLVAKLISGVSSVVPNYSGRLYIIGKGSLLLSNATQNDAGNYTVTVTALGDTPATRNFEVTIYDLVRTVTVTQSLQVVSESSPAVNLSCNGSSGYNETVTWMKDGRVITNNSNYNLLDGNQILQIIQPNRTFSGIYSCDISNATYWSSGSLQLRVYDPVRNVTVIQSLQVVSENSPAVNLSCSASSGYNETVTWMKDGRGITNNSNYNLLDGNQILQIIQPNRTFSGNYSCNISNAAYWSSESLQLRVYDPVRNVTAIQSLQVVSENSPAVNLSCSASSGYNETVTWMKDGRGITNNSNYNLLDGNQTLQIIQPNRTFSGIYICNISNAAYWSSESLQLRVYDPVVNVKVTQSPQKVSEGAALVNLSCNASSGYTETVTWLKDGQSVISKNSYSLLDGNWTLQIMRPDRTFNGLYTCNISNAAYWGSGSTSLTVSYAALSSTSTYSMMIITLLGGILLAY